MNRSSLRSTDGHRWAFMSRFDIKDIDEPDRTYLTRWRLLQTPLFGIYLHKILMDDGYRPLHDHPWAYATWILLGGYIEELAGGRRRKWRAGSFHRVQLPGTHAIRVLLRVPTWSLFFTGPRVREWGFHTPEGWVQHEEYIAAARKAAS